MSHRRFPVLLAAPRPERGGIFGLREHVVHKADPRNPRDRGIVEIWQGFNFHACRITVAQFQRI